MSTINVTAASNFDMAPDCRTTVHVKKGDKVDISLSSAKGMIDAGQIKEPSNFAAMLEGTMTTKDSSPTEEKSVGDMNKAELTAHAESIGMEVDKSMNKSDLSAAVQEHMASSDGADEESTDA